MSKFDNTYNSLLTEMPHVSLDLPSGKHIDFDLELEYIKTIEELEDLFNRILSGEEIVTHRGNTYKLSTHEERIAFLTEIRKYLEWYLEYKFNMSLISFLNSLS